jgi:hypothetical protein
MEAKRIIYALKCPFTNSIHYVGKSTIGMIRPLQHLKKSHSEKVSEWVNELKKIGHAPVVSILEYVAISDDIDTRERYWIQKELNNGSYLLNSVLINPLLVIPNLEQILGDDCGNNIAQISTFIKERRKSIGMTQPEFSERFSISLITSSSKLLTSCDFSISELIKLEYLSDNPLGSSKLYISICKASSSSDFFIALFSSTSSNTLA